MCTTAVLDTLLARAPPCGTAKTIDRFLDVACLPSRAFPSVCSYVKQIDEAENRVHALYGDRPVIEAVFPANDVTEVFICRSQRKLVRVTFSVL